MKKIIIGMILLMAFSFVFVKAIYADHAIPGIIFSSDITEGVKTKISVGSAPFGVAINSTTNKIYVCNSLDNTVSVIDGSNNSRKTNITVENDPRYLAVNEKTNKIYVANRQSNTVSVIDGSINTVVASIMVGQKPYAIAVFPDANKIFVTNEESNTVSVIDGNTNSVRSNIQVGQFPQGIAINNKTNRVYVANYNSNTVSLIDAGSETISKTFANITTPQDIAIDESANRIFVVSGSSILYVIDGSSNSEEATLSIAKNATNVAFHPTTGKVYVTVTFNGTIEVLDGRKLKPVYILGAIVSPVGIAVNNANHFIYVADRDGGLVHVVEDTLIKSTTITTTATPTPISEPEPTATPEPEPTSEPTPTETPVAGNEFGENVVSVIEQIKLTLDDIQDVTNELKSAHKQAKRIGANILLTVSRLRAAINLIEEGGYGEDPSIGCPPRIDTDLSRLDESISRLETKECKPGKKRRCIPVNIVDEFESRLEEPFDSLSDLINTDGDVNGIIDICEVVPTAE